MIKRKIAAKLKELSEKFQVITITGPRQSGKTTLARMEFPDHTYISLEDIDEREMALNDPRGFLKRFSRAPVILDEVQRVPGLFSYLQTHVDEHKQARFILTGSQNFLLLDSISQSLAGRCFPLTLLPFSLAELTDFTPLNPKDIFAAGDKQEIKGRKAPGQLDAILRKGFYPRIHDQQLAPYDWLNAYYQTYIERDVRTVLKVGNLETFSRFVRLCAGRSGGILNMSSLANDCGITHPTAKAWLSILRASNIIFLLQPHYRNFSKRLIKSPKLYFFDTGLLCFLLKIREEKELEINPLRGQIFETFIISEIYKSFTNRGDEPPLYYWRDHTGNEIDLLLDFGQELVPVEIKAGATVGGDYFKGLKRWLNLSGNPQDSGVVIYGGDQSYTREGIHLRSWFSIS